jgi:hypothetical protein
MQASVSAERGTIRLAELVASLSLATDLGRGEPMEHSMRQTVIALRIASVAARRPRQHPQRGC